MDVEFCNTVEALNQVIYSVSLSTPNCPDMNVLDLWYYNAIQFLQLEVAPRNFDEYILEVYESFKALPWSKPNDILLILQKMMETCIFHDRSHD